MNDPNRRAVSPPEPGPRPDLQGRIAAGPRFRRPWSAVTLLAVFLVLFGRGGARAADGPPPAVPTDPQRAAYWIDRLVRGPEPMSFPIPRFHKELLADAERNLVALGPVTLERLADLDLIERLQGLDDTNPWHAILGILASLAPRQPDVARAWAVPALRHSDLTMRRAAIVVFEALRSPADAPVLLEALARNAEDRNLGPRLAGILLRFGAPHDAETARVLFARAVGDRPDGTSGLWDDLAAVASDTPERARPDLLAWWGLLTETAGPRAPDPAKVGMSTGRSLDPARMAVVASPHALTSGRLGAAEARFALARQGNVAARTWVEADLASGDPVVRDVARRVVERPSTPAEREATRATAAGYAAALSGSAPPTPAEVASVARALRSDESPEALRLLEDLFRALPPTPAWKAALLDTFDGLVLRGGALEDAMRRLLASGSDDAIDLAFMLMRRSGGPAYVPIIEEFLGTPAGAARRFRVRRELAFLYAARRQHADLDPAAAAKFAQTLRDWIEDPEDPSAGGLVGALPDLGPAGEAELAKGLASPARGLYLAGLVVAADRYLGRDVVTAVLAPLDRRTASEERRRLLSIAFRIASASAIDVFSALEARLSEEGVADVEAVARIVRNRPR